MLIEKISDKEVDMINTWRKRYAYSYNAHIASNNFIPVIDLLREWESKKSEYLATLFGDNLIMTKTIKYEKSFEELQDELIEMTSYNVGYGRAGRNGNQFRKAWCNFLCKHRQDFNLHQLEGLHDLMDDESLITNKYIGKTFEIECSNGKKYRINRGCKTSKALGKLANIFNLPGWEDYRICLSQILNQRELTGELTISIHPLDYMTMSDNTYGWESCMSWEEEGIYRQGTVEMMNSKCVIVAYLAGNDPMSIGKYFWNNKKWRQLFVFDPNLIIGVKDYPYHNSELGKEVINWIKDLAKERLGWNYGDIVKHNIDSNIHFDSFPDEKNEFWLDIYTDNMYDDFGCTKFHWLALSLNINPDDINDADDCYHKTPFLTIPYSGASQCMVCGNLNPSFENESCLACDICQYFTQCEYCGDFVEESFEVDEMIFCADCYDSLVHKCLTCNEEHCKDYLSPIWVLPRLTAEKMEAVKTQYINCYGKRYLSNKESSYPMEFNYFKDEDRCNFICAICKDEDCLEDFIKDFMKPGERPHLREVDWNKGVCVYLDQLNKNGANKLARGFYNDNEGYINSFNECHITPSKFIHSL